MEHGFDRVWPSIPAQQNGRLIAFQHKRLRAGSILLPGSIEALEGGARVAALHPLGLGPELEASQAGVVFDGVDGADELIHIHAVDGGNGCSC